MVHVHSRHVDVQLVLANANVLTTFKLIEAPMVGSSAPNLDCRPDPLANALKLSNHKPTLLLYCL